MKKNKEIEKILLNGASYDEMVKSKVERDFEDELEIQKKLQAKSFITDIKKAPKNKLFTKDAVYEVLNKDSKTKSYVNGLQAEGYLGAQSADRTKLLNGETDAFVCGNCYVKFVKVKV